MPVKDDSVLGPPGGDTAQVLARRLSEAVRNVGTGNGNGNGNGAGGPQLTKDRARRAAADVGAAILAEASTGTAEHSDDVVLITEAIGQRMDVQGDYAAVLLAAARLHDIGKAWIPGEVLHKAGPLSVEEWELMRQHTVVGEQILSAVEELHDVARLVRHSHERWDGHGYPDGLAGPEIPLGSRIIFCADAFHAIRCDRPYRAGRSAREALAEIKRNAGTQFDPQVATALERVVHERNRPPLRGGGSARLFALLMCLVLGGAGSAIARSGALGEAPAPRAASPPPACGTAACPSVAGPVGGLGPGGALNGEPGPRPLFPGLPGQLHSAAAGNNGKHLAKGHHKGKHHGNGTQQGKGKNGKGKNGKGHGTGHGKASASHGHSGESSGTPTSSSSPGNSGGSGGSQGSSGHHGSGGGHSSRGHRGGSSVSQGNGNANGHNK